MKIAVIGSGISGNVAAYKLCANHEVTVFEKNDYIGGHTHTHDINLGNQELSVDTGFIVFNDRTYPNFNKLLNEIGVGSQETEMSFSVKSETSGLEYNGSNLDTLFAQRRNIINPRFYKLVFEILRFNKLGKEFVNLADDLTLKEFMQREKFSNYFSEHYLLPMGAAIWSTDPDKMADFPAKFFLRFFENHGLLDINNRPQWHVIPGGSKQYIEPLVKHFKDSIRLNAEVTSIRRADNGVYVTATGQAAEHFDAAFIASHSDETLKMLTDASNKEQEVLGAIKYQANEAVLHTDVSVLPKRKKAWAAWNYNMVSTDAFSGQTPPVALTYNMNLLQGLTVNEQINVTLNYSDAIDQAKIIKRLNYHHPIFTPDSIAAQSRQAEINGELNCYYCGAYWGNGFHEDGVLSALNAVSHFESQLSSRNVKIATFKSQQKSTCD